MKILTTFVGATALIISSGCSSAPMTPKAPSNALTGVRSPLAQFYSPAPTPAPVQYVLQERAEVLRQKSVRSAFPMSHASAGDKLADDQSRPTWFDAGN